MYACTWEPCISDVDLSFQIETWHSTWACILFQSCESYWDLLATPLPPHSTQGVSTWSLVFYLHTLIVLSSLEGSGWPDLGCLAGCPPLLEELISYVHSSWSSEASADLCPTSPSLHLSPHWYIEEQKQARTRKKERRLETGCQRVQKPAHLPVPTLSTCCCGHRNRRDS